MSSIQEAYERQLKERRLQEQSNSSNVVELKENKKPVSYDAPRIDDIKNSLSVGGYNDLMQPNEVELKYVSSIYQNKKYHDINNVVTDDIVQIGSVEMGELGEAFKSLTSKISGIDSAVLFSLTDQLMVEVDKSNLDGILQKALKTKPTLLSRMMGVFVKGSERKSVSEQLRSLHEKIKLQSGNLESKFKKIEDEMVQQKKNQERSIQQLEVAYDLYYQTFLKLRRQFALVVYIEHAYKYQLEQYQLTNKTSQDIVVTNNLENYRQTYRDIQNKRLILHKTLLQLPITADSYRKIISVNKANIHNIDDTIITALPMIRGNVIGIHSALIAQQGILTAQSISELNRNTLEMQSKLTDDVLISSERFVGEQRLKDSNTVLDIVKNIEERAKKVNDAREQTQSDIDKATENLKEATVKLKEVLNV